VPGMDTFVRASTRNRFAGRCLALRQLCFQAEIVNRPPRGPRPPARSPAEHAAAIAQPDIRRDVICFAAPACVAASTASNRARPVPGSDGV
jgi:hypothetical protein